ncbi:hypothetical protein HPP92_000965 [Vanilla planifolia]|uniref:rRNA methylase YtqB n=1 Tax=Vanilla planifolia TaxID=51239 RepID=A0A835RVF6_VANPL|nr:hypothetical protein HPP92_000965 [Vanilla planifolia]
MRAVKPFALLPKFLLEPKSLTLALSFPLRMNASSLCSCNLFPLRRRFTGLQLIGSAGREAQSAIKGEDCPSVEFLVKSFPIAGAQEALLGFMTCKRKATDAAHSVWKHVIHGGNTVVDATCGNGYDTVALLNLIADGSNRGCVYGMDIQASALENTSSLLRDAFQQSKRELVKLFLLCHSRMEDVVQKEVLPVRLVAFNLGYLPGGDKTIVTKPNTTALALLAASRILGPGGLISMVVYVGHLGGREELQAVLSFISNLPVENWVSFVFETVDRPNGPVLVFIFKR